MSKLRLYLRPWRQTGGLAYLQVFLCAMVSTLLVSISFRMVLSLNGVTPWIVLNLLLEGTFVVAFFAFQRSMFNVLLIQLIFGVLTRAINVTKIHFLDIPVLPSDLYLLNDAYDILPGYLKLCALLILPILFWIGYEVFQGWRWPKGIARLVPTPALAILVWIFAFPASYSGAVEGLVKNEEFGIPFLLKERSQTTGLYFSFSFDLAKFLEVKFASPSREEINTAIHQLARPAQRLDSEFTKKPNVYIILAESFWAPPEDFGDITDLLSRDFLKYWSASQRRYFLSPMFGGGTANVEFELLCGIPARSTGKGVVFQVSLANDLDCLPRILSRYGYKTFAFHPYNGGYYNRRTAYSHLGFDHFSTIEDYVEHSDPGDFVGDRSFISKSLEMARRKSAGLPFLAYMMTIAGHWPYAWKRDYDEDMHDKLEMPQKNVMPDFAIVERHLNVNKLSSKVLAAAIADIEKYDPGSVIVVAGDHLPGLANDTLLKVDSEDIKDWRFYRTPLIVMGPTPTSSIQEPFAPAYTIGREVLNRMGLADSAQSHFPLFQPPEGLIVRGVSNGATFVLDKSKPKSDFELCTKLSTTPLCVRTYDWLMTIYPLAIDLVAGSQFIYSAQPSAERQPSGK